MRLLIVVVICLAVVSTRATQAQVQAQTLGLGDSTFQACSSWQGHLHEACMAYIINDAHLGLQPYYKFGNSRSGLLSSWSLDRLRQRYTGKAYNIITQRVASWPKGTNTVQGPDITISDARSSLSCNRAVLKTTESWVVRDKFNNSVFVEYETNHVIVLQRVPDQRLAVTIGGKVRSIHKWVVTNIDNVNPNMSLC